jgi:bifunctional DNA-binding transcriptional regulator/antitoxin component of YhaV-PrlF toxin-antitoxin module
MEATLDKFGQIVIPKEIRDDFNLRPASLIRSDLVPRCFGVKKQIGHPSRQTSS